MYRIRSIQSGSARWVTTRPGIIGLMLWLLLQSSALAQQFTTVTGGGFTINPQNPFGGTTRGSAADQFDGPVDVVMDGAGNFYVADKNNHRIQKFPPDSEGPDWTGHATDGVTVAGGNGAGSAANQLNAPNSICLDKAGNLYVADATNNRIQKFPPNSTSATAGVTVAGGNGAGDYANQFDEPSGVFVDESNNLYVGDRYNSRVMKFPPNSTSTTAGDLVAKFTGGYLQFNYITDLFVDRFGNIYVASYGPQLSPFPLYPYADSRITKFSGNAQQTTLAGMYDGMANPQGLFVSESGDLLIANTDAQKIIKGIFPPVILTQPPVSSTACSGDTVKVSLIAQATIPGPVLSYQWYSNSGPLSGQTSPTLILTQVNASASYYAVVTASNGLSTNSNPFDLTVLPSPQASLTASGQLSPNTPSVTLTASGGSTYQFGPGATQIGNGPTATVSTPGLYSVRVTSNEGCSSVASTSVSQAPSPDLTPTVYARPTTVSGSTPISVVVEVYELNGVPALGPLTVRLTKDPKVSLSFASDAVSVGGQAVQNRAWQFDGSSDDSYYVLTSSQGVGAGNVLSVGLTGTLLPGATSGSVVFTAVVAPGSGQEVKVLNNTDADRVDYFQQ